MRVGPQADKFGRFLVEKFRDEGLDFYDGLAASRWKSPSLQELQFALTSLSDEQRNIVRHCVIAALDSGLGNFLGALELAHETGDGIEVLVDGENVVNQSDGLAGELWSDRGWLKKYSRHSEVIQ